VVRPGPSRKPPPKRMVLCIMRFGVFHGGIDTSDSAHMTLSSCHPGTGYRRYYGGWTTRLIESTKGDMPCTGFT
jgi:hypothetical protein